MYLFTEVKKLDLSLALQLSSSTDKDEKKVLVKRMKISRNFEVKKTTKKIESTVNVA